MFRLASLALMLPLATTALAADGEQLYNAQCMMCHGVSGVGGPLGPSLMGVSGAKIASRSFAYSAALKAKDGTWTDANLDAWLKAPSKFAPGTKMFMAIPDDANRSAVIAYLMTLK